MELQNEVSAEEPVDLPLVFDAEGEPVSGFKIIGANSRSYQDVDRAWKIKTVKKTARRGHGIDAKQDTGAAELVNMTEQREFETACACIVGIYGFTLSGTPAELSPETLRTIFDKRPTWLSKVINAIENDALFTKA